MLKVTVLSLLLGAVAFILVVTQVFAPPALEVPAGLPLAWNSTTVIPQRAAATAIDGQLTLTLPATGIGLVSLEIDAIPAQAYPYLHLAIENPPQDLSIAISFVTEDEKIWTYTLGSTASESIWLATNELVGWSGTIKTIRFIFSGTPGQVIIINELALYTASPVRQLRAIFSDFTTNTSWKRANMNTHTGVDKVSSFYPVPLIALFFLLSIFSYGIILLLGRKLTFNWKVVAIIFLACWLCLDLIWQNRLLHQVAYSYRTFAGKDTTKKLAVAPDARLFQFISKVKAHLPESLESRIFVSSSDIYLGMRGAYYLFPYNAFWSLEPPEVPPEEFIRSGDYILLLNPTTTRFYPDRGQIGKVRASENRPLGAERVLYDPAGSLVRIR